MSWKTGLASTPSILFTGLGLSQPLTASSEKTQIFIPAQVGPASSKVLFHVYRPGTLPYKITAT